MGAAGVMPGALARNLDYLWRLIGTGTAFALFGLGGALASVTVFPAISLSVHQADARVAATCRFIRLLFRLFVRFLIVMRIIEFDVDDTAKLNSLRGVMVVANHPTLIDVVLIMSLVPDAQCVVKSRLWRNPFLGGVVRAAGYIRNDGDPQQSIADCAAALATGRNLVIFPEGSRTVPGVRPKLKRGFAHAALHAQADILPIVIFCTPTTLTKRDPWFAIPPTRARFRFVVKQQIDVLRYTGRDTPAIAARKLTRDVDQIFANELGYE